jgi:hypothetical protein
MLVVKKKKSFLRDEGVVWCGVVVWCGGVLIYIFKLAYQYGLNG